MNIEVETIKECKRNFINMSEVCQDALDKALNKQKVEIDTSIGTCEFCEREMDRATSDNPDKGLIWLWPDEKWICNPCFKRKGASMSVTPKPHY